jgi:hypothetical protein
MAPQCLGLLQEIMMFFALLIEAHRRNDGRERALAHRGQRVADFNKGANMADDKPTDKPLQLGRAESAPPVRC